MMPTQFHSARSLRVLATAFAAATLLSACNDKKSTEPPIMGVFIDSAVEGVDYTVGSSLRGQTSARGEFSCQVGEAVTFAAGAVVFGSAPCAPLVTPLTLSATTNIKDVRVVNRLLALQLFDDDSDPANGIKVTAEVKAALVGRALDFNLSADAFNAALVAVLNVLPAKYKARPVNNERRILVAEHFENTLGSRLNTPVVETVTQTNGVGAVSATVTRYQIQAANSFYVPYEGSNAAIKNEFPNGFLPSFGSGLAFKGTATNGDLEFYGLTDRGPNGDGPNVITPNSTASSGAKIFPSPSFAPAIGIITVGRSGAVLASSQAIKVSAGVNASGLPIPIGSLGNSAEVPLFESMKYDAASKAIFNANGLDTEAIAVDRKRNVLWVAGEYGPFILKIDPATNTVAAKFAPDKGLPSIFAKRRANRGIEGMALDTTTDKLHAFLQSPLTDGNAFYSVTNSSQRVERFARFTRWIEFDPATEKTTRMFAYPLDGAQYADGRTGNAKLGDVVALGNGKFIVIEQGAGPSGVVFNKLMLVELGNASDISATSFNPATSDLEKSSMAATAVNGANWASVVSLKKTLLFDLNAAGWLAEKAEGLTIVDANTLALANDNDFGLKSGMFDANGVEVPGVDVTACNFNADGVMIPSAAVGCVAGNTIRVARGSDMERPSRLWLIKFSAPLISFNVPAGN